MPSLRNHQFVRMASTIGGTNKIGVDLYNGFVFNGTNTLIYNMQMSFSLTGVQLYSGGGGIMSLAMPNYTEFVNLYDQYRIDWVEVEFVFSNNSSGVGTPTTCLPLIYLAKDYDNSGTAGIADLQQYHNCQMWQLGEQRGSGKRVIRLKPSVADALYNNSAVTTGYGRAKPMFIDTDSPLVPHYGIKLAMDPITPPGSTSLVGYLSINVIYHMTMNNTK